MLKIANSDDTRNAGDTASATDLANCLQGHPSNLHAPQTKYSIKCAIFGELEPQVYDRPHGQNKDNDVKDKICDRYAPVPGLYGKTIFCIEELLLESSIDWSALQYVGRIALQSQIKQSDSTIADQVRNFGVSKMQRRRSKSDNLMIVIVVE